MTNRDSEQDDLQRVDLLQKRSRRSRRRGGVGRRDVLRRWKRRRFSEEPRGLPQGHTAAASRSLLCHAGGRAVEAGPDRVEKTRRVEKAPRLWLKKSALKGPDERGDSLALSKGAQERKGLG